MRYSIIFITLLITVASCNQDKDLDSVEVMSLLPCKIGINNDKTPYYSLDFDGRVLVVADDNYKPVYDDFEFIDLYPVLVSFSKDSISNEWSGDIQFNINDFLNLYADTLKTAFYEIGGYIYPDFSIKNIVYSDDSLAFDISLMRANDLEYIVNASLIFEENKTILSINKDYIDKLYDVSNPVIIGQTSSRYLFNTLDSINEIYDLKLSYYKTQHDRLLEEIKTMNPLDTLYSRNQTSIKYLNHLIKAH